MNHTTFALEAAADNIEKANGISLLETLALRRRMQFLDVSSTFVAQGDRLRSIAGDIGITHGHQVAMAQRSRCDLDKHLIVTWLRYRHIIDNDLLVELEQVSVCSAKMYM